MQDVQKRLAAAVACVESDELDAAEDASRSILRSDPRCPRALHILGVVARKTDRLPLAIAVLQEAAELNPDDAGIRCELGLALSDAHREEESIVHYQRSIEINPQYADAALNLAAALDRLEQPEAALPRAQRARELSPTNPIAHFNLGNVWRALGELDRASAAFRAAIRLDPSFANAHWNNACSRLLAGDFAVGWKEYEWREKAGEVALDHYPQPRWQGESLAGRTILVHAEQGIGDEILFASCLPDLIARAGHCVVVCEPRLERLFARSFPQATVHGIARRKDRAGAKVLESIDKQIPAGSLPLYLRGAPEKFPQRRQFLLPEPNLQSDWRKRLESLGPGPKIGISWRAGGQPSERRKRTIRMDQWDEIFSVKGVHFINLQYGETADEIAAARREMGVEIHDLDGADPLINMDAFAAKVAALDLVISVGNATVHLAGALGVPAWALLPKVPGWRWMIDGDRSLWYPSVRLFRQRERGQWQPVFAEVAELLAQIAVAPNPADALTSDPTSPISAPLALCATAGRAVAVGERSVASIRPFTAPFDPDATFDGALKSFARGDLAEAESLCSRVLDHAPRHVPSLNLLGQIARQTGRLDLAIRTLGRAVAVADQNPNVRMNLAAAQHEAGQLAAAAASYQKAIKLDANLADAYFGLGKVFHALRQQAEAIVALEQTMRLCPDHHKALNLLGGTYLEGAQWIDAERAFRAAIRLRPDYMAAHNNLGMALERQGRLPEAMACYDRAVELDQRCLQAVNNLAGVLTKLGQHAAAALVQGQAAGLRAAG